MSVSETGVNYLVQSERKHDTMEPVAPHLSPRSLAQLERMLIPLLNLLRQMQGKPPVIVPKG